MGLRSLSLNGRSRKFGIRDQLLKSCCLQLPDPNARTFTVPTLRKAMLDTIATLNKYAEEAGITEVCPLCIRNTHS